MTGRPVTGLEECLIDLGLGQHAQAHAHVQTAKDPAPALARDLIVVMAGRGASCASPGASRHSGLRRYR